MHTFLADCWLAFLGEPCQRLTPPTYWFIRGDLEPPCHMLPQMGTSPQAIQALWQQAWAIMDAKEKGEKELCQRPRRHKLCVCTFTSMDYRPMSMHVCSVWMCSMDWSYNIQYNGIKIPYCRFLNGHRLMSVTVYWLAAVMPIRAWS